MRQEPSLDDRPGAAARPAQSDMISILDVVSFRIAQLNAIFERDGALWLRQIHNLSLNEWRVIGLVQALGPVHQHVIRDYLSMDKGQLSRIVKTLVARGEVATNPSTEDARATVLSLSDQGRGLHDGLLSFTQERNEEVVGALDPSERRELLRLLGKIIERCRE